MEWFCHGWYNLNGQLMMLAATLPTGQADCRKAGLRPAGNHATILSGSCSNYEIYPHQFINQIVANFLWIHIIHTGKIFIILSNPVGWSETTV